MARLIEDQGCPCRIEGDPAVRVGPEVVIDTRQVSPGALFVGLPGEHVDGADLAPAAGRAGAGAALVGHPVDADLPCLVSPQAAAGLSALARGLVDEQRRRGLVTFAITGSAGKTSTKDLLAQVLAASAPTVSPVGNHNNEIGVPLTACALDDTTRFLVSEMGARGIGHIAALCRIVPPTISTVLNVGTAHLGEFGSRDAIARAKGEILEALPPDGWAVLNAGDPRVDAMEARTRARIARWCAAPGGSEQDVRRVRAELVVSASQIAFDDLDRASFTLHARTEDEESSQRVRLGLIGAHQLPNAVAAATMALAAGLGLDAVADALSHATTRSPLRMELHETAGGAAIINDCYNANPESVEAALGALADIGRARRRSHPGARTIAVLGDMAELGSQSAALHAAVGSRAGELGIDEVIGVGEFGEIVARAAQSAGARARRAAKQEVAGLIELCPGDVVLVKASRVLKLEEITDQLLDRAAGGAEGRIHR
ncbi:UDP-N-acetylmuramoyl-tripeptide--D-alanyl-D-alanine ligase [Propionibacterium cyclohexanicum]|uniref:UDP-N-acetylmuramoyl-tripeptide--D-alanyl-D- alanine ligase n=1 Tax=Propionibacterium cyclohexanicum TaxID=64702 RepID=UPI001FE1C6C2|nr:UDP-N-acetylmuramoyl-tripeptide--D-alanyl-D-alanine ligase [Propionibacterium cyclohexanicum]